MSSSGTSPPRGGSGTAAGKQKAMACICTDEQKRFSSMFKCAFCCEMAGVKRIKTETDSEWDPYSPSRKSVIESVPTPKSIDSNATNLPDDPPNTPSVRAPSYASSVLTTPKFGDEPAIAIDYSPFRATGKELEDRKNGIFLREKPGDDDDRY